MEVLTEMDEYFNAMSKINMDEPVMPYVKGRLVESDTYNKVQKILNTPELEKAHMYCYDLDLENLEECDIMKINNLYKLGVDRGFIDDDFQYQDCEPTDGCSVDGPKPEDPVVEPAKTQTNPRAKIPCFVAMYSAMKDGQIKTGEAYSRAISVQAAKADVIAQLSRFGYTNISILAIEATEEDACACSLAKDMSGAISEDDYLKGRVHNGHLPESEEVAEDDMLDGRTHNGHLPESEDDASDDASDDTSDDTSSDDVSDDTEENSDDAGDADTEDAETSTEDFEDGEVDTLDTEDSEDSDDSENNEDTEDSESDTEDDETNSDDSEDSDDSENNEDTEDSTDSEDDKKEELDDNEKAELKDNYKKTFKNTMLKCKFEEKSFDDLTLKEKVKFFTELSKTWKEEYEPTDFMTDKEVDQLNKIVVKK